jgi:hypothetical protein
MIKLLKSKKFEIPKVFLVTERSEIKELPVGIPFIFADKKRESNLVKLLEYEVLFQNAIRSGYPFNFKQILKDNGYLDLIDFGYGDSVYMEFTTEGLINKDGTLQEFSTLEDSENMFKQFIKDSSAYVDVQKLKDLNVFPIWLDKIEKAIETNIHNFAIFNSNMYNKKLDGMYGGLELTSPNKNLLGVDISGSIPRAVSTTLLNLVKTLAETFYADLFITGSITTFYSYEELYKLDVEKVYENGMNNDQAYFKKMVSADEKHYKTAIIFGDNDSPCRNWASGDKTISIEDGKKLCKWSIDHLISFHTKGTAYLAAYSTWFSPKTEERIANWCKYLT